MKMFVPPHYERCIRTWSVGDGYLLSLGVGGTERDGTGEAAVYVFWSLERKNHDHKELHVATSMMSYVDSREDDDHVYRFWFDRIKNVNRALLHRIGRYRHFAARHAASGYRDPLNFCRAKLLNKVSMLGISLQVVDRLDPRPGRDAHNMLVREFGP